MAAIVFLIVFALMVFALFVQRETVETKLHNITRKVKVKLRPITDKVKSVVQPVFQAVNVKFVALWVGLSALLTPLFLPAITHAQSASISLDMTPFFTALNT